jgi:hypothetical protein
MPVGLVHAAWITATLGGKRLRKSGVDEVFEPWWVILRMVMVSKYKTAL